MKAGHKRTHRNRPSHLRPSKSKDFLKKIKDNTMVDYLTRLRILNPASQLHSQLNEPRREGGFVRLAHAREEFTAPVLNKGKAFELPTKKTSQSTKKRQKSG